MTDHALRPECATFQGEIGARVTSAEKRIKVIEDHNWGIYLAVLGVLVNIIITLFKITL